MRFLMALLILTVVYAAAPAGEDEATGNTAEVETNEIWAGATNNAVNSGTAVLSNLIRLFGSIFAPNR